MSNALIADRDRFSRNHVEERFPVNGRDWGGIRTGDRGPALILIPGTLGRADIFWQQIEALEGRARILSLSYPAAGGIVEWAQDIATLVQQQGLEDAVVLGSSLGGYLAQYFTATHGDLVSGLIAANTLGSVSGIDRMPPYSLDLTAVPIEHLREGFTAGLSEWRDGESPYGELAELLLLEVAGRISETEMRARLNALKTAPDLPPQTLPHGVVYTVESGDDHLISKPMREALRSDLNPSRAFCFGMASHFPYVTRPWQYTALIEEALGLRSNIVFPPDCKEVNL